jgi:hypothetical protein
MVAHPDRKLIGYIDRNGKMVVAPQFGIAGPFKEGLACVRFDNGKRGYIDKTGKFAIQPEYSDANYFSEGLAAVNLFGVVSDPINTHGGRWGYIDKTGKMVINAKFEFAAPFNHGLALVTVEGKDCYIDTNGNFVWKPRDYEKTLQAADSESK